MTISNLSKDEQAVLDRELGWAKSWELTRVASQAKLFRVITPQDEEQYYTLRNTPEVELVFHEPVWFEVTVQAVKDEHCRAGHRLGDRWGFSWCTPAGLCGAAYHAMYPVLHGLMLTSGRYEGPAAEETLVSCPDECWITFRIVRQHWMPELWRG
jgi:uncharacterized repeat protein (TIGR04076 family)